MSSFKKKTTTRGRPPLPQGTRLSLHNNQLLVSSGVPSLDVLIGGGMAVGTLTLIEEDLYSAYSNMLHKFFLAEAVVTNQEMFIAHTNPQDILNGVPTCTDDVADKQTTNEELKIAWRYQEKYEQPKAKIEQFGHYFDLSKTITKEKLASLNYTCHCPDENNIPRSSRINLRYKTLLDKIKDKMTELAKKPPLSVLRIGLPSLGSPLWEETGDNAASLSWFLLSLKALLRTSLAVCCVSVPTHLFQENSFVERIERCCDTVVRLESFAGSNKETNPVFKDYHGFFHIIKLTSLNCIVGKEIDTSDLAFKLKRKKFSIEKMHLPPDVSETASRSQNKPLCSPAPTNSLDF